VERKFESLLFTKTKEKIILSECIILIHSLLFTIGNADFKGQVSLFLGIEFTCSQHSDVISLWV